MATSLKIVEGQQRKLYKQEDEINDQIAKLEEKRARIWNKKMKVLRRWREITERDKQKG